MTLEQRLKLIISQLDELLKQLNGEPLTEQLPVYDAEWLANVVNRYDDIYWLNGSNISVGGITMSCKDSAPIVMAALAKELNGDWDGSGQYATIQLGTRKSKYFPMEKSSLFVTSGEVKFKSPNVAQKAIEILSNFPEILPNYFKP